MLGGRSDNNKYVIINNRYIFITNNNFETNTDTDPVVWRVMWKSLPDDMRFH